MNIAESRISGVYEVNVPAAYLDERGTLFRLFDAQIFEENGIRVQWQQVTYQFTKAKNVIRGLYTQLPPHTEMKLVSILSGMVFWVVVDLRKNSDTFGEWHGVTLSPTSIKGLVIERGFAHGCLSLTGDCQVIICADNYYSEADGVGIAWNDPELNVAWPDVDGDLIISDTHKAYPSFALFRETYRGI